MRRTLPLLACLTLPLTALAQDAGSAPPPAAPASTAPAEVGRRIALVIGISSYEKLPASLSLDTPRTEAARVAAALEQGAGFDQVRLLTDASASYANVQSVLEEQVSKEVQWRDLFLVYFVGQGIGGDYGDPRLLFYDTDPDQLETTSVSVRDLAALLQKWVPASRYVVVTDAAHEGTLNNLALLGPTGNDWPVIGNQSFVLSSTAPRQVTVPGVFSKAFVEALSGQADTNGDGVVSGSELNGYLVLAVPNNTGGRQLPTVQSKYNPSIEITRKKVAAPVAAAEPAKPTVVARRFDKVKFVFPDGQSQKVQCQEMVDAQECDNSCYLFDVAEGDCTVSGTIGGSELKGTVPLKARGLYACAAKDGALACTPPQQ